MSNKEPGYVYILTNPSFREDWVKIGKSSRPVDIRSKELDNTAVPLPFEIYATLKTVKYSEVERAVHQTIDSLTDLRIRQIENLTQAVYSTRQLMSHSEATYLEVLTAQQSLLSARLQQVSDRFEGIQGVINLYRALGGGVDTSVEPAIEKNPIFKCKKNK